MKYTGLAKKELLDPRDVYVSDLEFGSTDNKTRWGMTEKQIDKLKKDNQRSHGTCVGQTMAKMMEAMEDEDFSARYIYVNTDRLFEASNKGGLQTINGFKFLKLFGAVEEDVCEDDNKLDFEEYYDETPTVIDTVKDKKVKIGAYVRVDTNIEAIKQAFENLDFISVSVRQYSTRKGRYFGDWIRRFIYQPGAEGGHAMMVTHMEKKEDGKHYLYTWNSWGDGPGLICLEDFPPSVIFIYGGTMDEEIINKVEEVVTVKKETVPTYKYFAPYEIVGLKHELVELLDKARGIAGVPFVINSGYRSKARNEQVGGVADSAHMSGFAVDIKCTTSINRDKIIRALMEVGFTRIGIANTFIHADIDPTKPQNVIWTY